MRLAIYFMLSIGVLSSCSAPENTEEQRPKSSSTGRNVVATEDLNVNILLDLSDRIDTTKYPDPVMEVYQRDLELIGFVSEAFGEYIRSKRIRFLNENIGVFMEPIPPSREMNAMIEELRVEFDRNSRKEDVISLDSLYQHNVSSFYQMVLQEDKYIGSDIWSFFKNRAVEYCIKPGKRNVLFIFTDGYLYHPNSKFPMKDGEMSYFIPEYETRLGLTSDNWQEVLEGKNYRYKVPAGIDLSELEVYVLNLNPSKNNLYSQDVLKRLWSDWLQNMGVTKFDLRTMALPANEKDIIKGILLGN